MNYSELITELKNYKKYNLTDEEKSFIYKLITGHERTFNIKSYLRIKNQETNSRSINERALNLEKYNFIENTKGKFLTKSTNYKITSYGIFYILTNISNYPPQFLSRYSENIILQSLLFQYFDTGTINSCTSEFYSIVTHYLKQCTNLLSNLFGELHGQENNKEDKEKKIVKKIEKELTFYAKYLVFRIVLTYSDSNLLEFDRSVTDDTKVIIYEMENKMKLLLSRDSKFIRLLEIVNKEFNEGCKEILENNRPNESL